MISASKTFFNHFNLKILRPKVTKNIKVLHKKFCEFRPCTLNKPFPFFHILMKTWHLPQNYFMFTFRERSGKIIQTLAKCFEIYFSPKFSFALKLFKVTFTLGEWKVLLHKKEHEILIIQVDHVIRAFKEKFANTEFAYKKTNAIGNLGDRFQVLEKSHFYLHLMSL